MSSNGQHCLVMARSKGLPSEACLTIYIGIYFERNLSEEICIWRNSELGQQIYIQKILWLANLLRKKQGRTMKLPNKCLYHGVQNQLTCRIKCFSVCTCWCSLWLICFSCRFCCRNFVCQCWFGGRPFLLLVWPHSTKNGLATFLCCHVLRSLHSCSHLAR